jgi:hypothetical protein
LTLQPGPRLRQERVERLAMRWFAVGLLLAGLTACGSTPSIVDICRRHGGCEGPPPSGEPPRTARQTYDNCAYVTGEPYADKNGPNKLYRRNPRAECDKRGGL